MVALLGGAARSHSDSITVERRLSLPSDPWFIHQWPLSQDRDCDPGLGIMPAWQSLGWPRRSPGPQSRPKIALVDTGVNAGASDCRGRVEDCLAWVRDLLDRGHGIRAVNLSLRDTAPQGRRRGSGSSNNAASSSSPPRATTWERTTTRRSSAPTPRGGGGVARSRREAHAGPSSKRSLTPGRDVFAR